MTEISILLGKIAATLGLLSTALAAIPPAEYIVKPLPQNEPDRPIIAAVTAYTSAVEETDDTPFIAASGTSTRRGIVACPRRYPFGTLFLIEGKVYDCQDRMAEKNDGMFDIWVETKAEAYQWGVKRVEVREVVRSEPTPDALVINRGVEQKSQ